MNKKNKFRTLPKVPPNSHIQKYTDAFICQPSKTVIYQFALIDNETWE
jgi:hypothetical protein